MKFHHSHGLFARHHDNNFTYSSPRFVLLLLDYSDLFFCTLYHSVISALALVHMAENTTRFDDGISFKMIEELWEKVEKNFVNFLFCF